MKKPIGKMAANKASRAIVEPRLSKAVSQTGEPWINIVDKQRSVWVREADFSGTGTIAIRRLSELGVNIIGTKNVRQVIEGVAALNDFTERTFIEQIGWNGLHFALQNADVFSPTGCDTPEVLFKGDPRKSAASGSIESWRQGVAAPLAKHPIPAFFIMAAFAAPLLALLGRDGNFGYELVGNPGIGKSTLQKLMASVVGSPRISPHGYPIAMDATRVGLAAEMQRHSDLPLILEEAMSFAPGEGRQTRGLKLRELAMKLGEGHETRKDKREDPNSYRFVFVISTNEGLRDLTIGQSASSNDAAADRLIPLHFDDTRPFGVFHRRPKGFGDMKEFVKSLERAAAQHHGTAIREFLEKLVNHRSEASDQLISGLERRIGQFCASVCVDPDNGSEGRVAESFGIVLAAGLLARHYGILPHRFNCERAARACYRLYLNGAEPGSTFVDELKALARSGKPRELHKTRVMRLTNSDLDKRGAFLNRNRRNELELVFWPPYFQKKYPNFERLIRQPDVASIMSREGDRPTNKRLVRAGYPNDRFYCFTIS